MAHNGLYLKAGIRIFIESFSPAVTVATRNTRGHNGPLLKPA